VIQIGWPAVWDRLQVLYLAEQLVVEQPGAEPVLRL